MKMMIFVAALAVLLCLGVVVMSVLASRRRDADDETKPPRKY
jgi:hypothetical protein